MARLGLWQLSLACTLALVGCPGDTGGKEDSVGDTAIIDSGDCAAGADEDGDGFCPSTGDCDETDPAVNPDAAEICDGRDNDCDDEVDEDGETTYYLDSDADGFGDSANSVLACEQPDGYVANGDDCDDAAAAVYPGAEEICDDLDNDCDSEVDEGLTTTWYADADRDGYGDESSTVEDCEQPLGYIADGGDCNDAEPLAWTGATEVCDGIDNNCDGSIDEGLSTTYYRDADGDGYGDPATSQDFCTDPPVVWVANDGDCNDAEALAWTGASEYCDSVDNDCNGLIDDNALDATAVTADADGDGFGSPTDTEMSCDDGADNTWDCDDADPSEPVLADASNSGAGTGVYGDGFQSLQDAIDLADLCVVALDGTYNESIDYGSKDLTVTSANGADSTWIDAGGSGSVATFAGGQTAASVLDGFTLTGGTGTESSSSSTETCGSSVTCTTTIYAYCGGGVMVNGAAPTLQNLDIQSNTLPVYSYTAISDYDFEYVYSYGGGICVMDSSGTTGTGLNIHHNYANDGGGAYVSSTGALSLSQSTLGYNDASDGGGASAAGGSLSLTNAIVVDNTASNYGGGLYTDSGSITLWNVSAVANSGTSGGALAVAGSGWAGVYSSILASSSSGAGVHVDGSSALVDVTFSDVYGNAGGEYVGTTDVTGSSGNISADPMFTSWTDDDTDNDDFSLMAGSPAIDSGDSSMSDADGSAADMGAYGGPGGAW